MKLGFVSKYLIDENNNKYPFKTTTRTYFLKQVSEKREELLRSLVYNNIVALKNTIEELSLLHSDLRMMRIGSEMLPLYTVPQAQIIYKDIINDVESLFLETGNLARKNNVRLSFHPGQYTVLGSESENVVKNAIEDMEYHTLCAILMGYGKSFQDFKINIHMNGKAGFEGFKRSYNKLSPECRNMITVENDELSCSLTDVLQAQTLCPVVVDIHHNWVKENEFILPDSDLIKQVKDSWRGVRPVMHYSISKEGLIPEKGFPDQNILGLSKMKLRAHSDYYFNNDLNDWALSFVNFDIMCEVKQKNLARDKLFAYRESKAP